MVFEKPNIQNGENCRRIRLYNVSECTCFPIGNCICIALIERLNPNEYILSNYYASAYILDGKIQLQRDNGFSVTETTLNDNINQFKDNEFNNTNEYGHLRFDYSLEDLDKFRKKHKCTIKKCKKNILIIPKVTLFIFLRQYDTIYALPVVRI